MRFMLSPARAGRLLPFALALAVAAPASAAVETSEYSQCYEVAVVRPRPVAALEKHMPAGFTVAPFPDPAVPVSAYISVGYRCTTGGDEVVEILDLVPVSPPRELAGRGGNYLLLSGTTSLSRSAQRFASWCVDIGEGDVVFEQRTLDRVRAVSFVSARAGVETAIRSATTTGADGVSAAGTLRVLSASGGRIGWFDTTFTAASSSPLVGAVWSAEGEAEPAAAVHVSHADGAPNDWLLSGRCAEEGGSSAPPASPGST